MGAADVEKHHRAPQLEWMRRQRKNLKSDRSGCVGLVLPVIAGITQVLAALTKLVLTAKGLLVALAGFLVAWFALSRFGII